MVATRIMQSPLYMHTSVDNFADVNLQLLNEIENYKQLTKLYKPEGQRWVTHLDWKIDLPRTYMSILEKHICPLIDRYIKSFYYTKYEITHTWFHQYEDDSYYPWHHHMTDHIVGLYFVELPNPRLGTRFLNCDFIEFKTGDFILFPGWMPHYSPKNNTGNRKTIIALNIRLTQFDEVKINKQLPMDAVLA